MTTLEITFKNLNEDCRTAKTKNMKIEASNIHVLNSKFVAAELENNMDIEAWRLITNEFNSGNKGINASAYLFEILDEMVN